MRTRLGSSKDNLLSMVFRQLKQRQRMLNEGHTAERNFVCWSHGCEHLGRVWNNRCLTISGKQVPDSWLEHHSSHDMQSLAGFSLRFNFVEHLLRSSPYDPYSRCKSNYIIEYLHRWLENCGYHQDCNYSRIDGRDLPVQSDGIDAGKTFLTGEKWAW